MCTCMHANLRPFRKHFVCEWFCVFANVFTQPTARRLLQNKYLLSQHFSTMQSQYYALLYSLSHAKSTAP